jgi:hypothetical protein
VGSAWRPREGWAHARHPLPSAVMAFLRSYVEGTLAKQVVRIDSTTPLF